VAWLVISVITTSVMCPAAAWSGSGSALTYGTHLSWRTEHTDLNSPKRLFGWLDNRL
jgi:hypothetical protein